MLPLSIIKRCISWAGSEKKITYRQIYEEISIGGNSIDDLPDIEDALNEEGIQIVED